MSCFEILQLAPNSLTVSAKRQSVVTEPGGMLGRVVETMTLANTTRLLTNGSKTTRLTVLVNGVDNPVDTRIATDSLVRGINKDNLKELVSSILVNPVRVQYTQVRAVAANTLLSGTASRALVLEMVNTLVDGFTICLTLGDRALTTTTADTDAVDNITLLSLVTQTTSLVRTRRTAGTVDYIHLTVLPSANARQEQVNVRLLLLSKLFQVLVGTHFDKKAVVVVLCN